MNPSLTLATTAIVALAGLAATAEPVIKDLPPYAPEIDAAKFSADVTHPYFPLKPGTTYIFEGTRDGAPRHTEVTVTDETKVVMGVPCRVVRDVVTTGTELVEKTVDWYAQDSDGNVWYFGEDTAEYEAGKVTNTDGTWMAGVNGALPGVIMPAQPVAGNGYRQEFLPGIAEDYATVQQLDATAQIGGKTYDKVLVTEDIDLLDNTKLEHKTYAPGIGLLGTDGMVNGHREVTSLSKILQAS